MPAFHPTLVLVFKRPAPGVAKQRLARTIGTEPALRLAWALLHCALEDARRWPGPVVLAPAAADDADWAAGLLARPVTVVPQRDGNLGVRIGDLDRRLRDAGHPALIWVGSDAPALDRHYLDRTAAGLASHDVVLGPSPDGGVALMASRIAWPDLTDLAWSTPALGRELAQRCRARGLQVMLLPERADVDVADDLERLRSDLAGDSRPARVALRQTLESCKGLS